MSAPAPPAPIVLLTDFGESDWYVAAMKGVLLARAPGAALVDLTHSVPPGDVRRAGYLLERAAPAFPRATVFLCVVDPGVGTDRRPIAAQLRFGSLYVGPDNGIVTGCVGEPPAVREIGPQNVGASSLSNTFHGRDLFAPAAAYLASGGAFDRIGALVLDPVLLPRSAARRIDGHILAEVVAVDRFGNCVTNARTDLIRGASGLCVYFRDRIVARGLYATYGDAPNDQPCVIVGSDEWLEIALKGGHAALRTGLSVGSEIRITAGGRGGE